MFLLIWFLYFKDIHLQLKTKLDPAGGTQQEVGVIDAQNRRERGKATLSWVVMVTCESEVPGIVSGDLVGQWVGLACFSTVQKTKTKEKHTALWAFFCPRNTTMRSLLSNTVKPFKI